MSQTRRSQLFVCLVSVLALLAWAYPTFAVTVEEIPNPRPNGWSVDLTGTIPAEALQQIDRLGDEVKAANGAEIGVVVIDSTGGVPSRDFAKSLFDHWKIGESNEDNGFLILAAMTDRKVEIVLGRGLDTPANNQTSTEIMQEDIVPLLRAGDPGGALLAGTRAAARRILGVAPPVAETATPLPPQAPAQEPVAPLPSVETAPSRSKPSGRFMAGAALAVLGLIGGAYFLRRAPRCGQCRTAMILLGEQEDDSHLTPAERTEERIGSVDHEIWLCTQCGTTKKKSRNDRWWYSRCSSCGAKAACTTSWVVVTSPTYSSEGERRMEISCAHCGHRSSSTMAIPRLVETRNDDSSRWSSSSSDYSSVASAGVMAAASTYSDSSSSSDSGSSDSGSSDSGYSGGESSDGGASGSW